jgi:RNA polymerase sigma-70 factor (ECF subfamily)
MDNQLLKQLYQKYQKEIYLYLYSLCKNRDLAEDLVQETFLKAILSLPNEHTNVRAWLYMVARNLYFNYTKKEKKQVPLDEFGAEMCDEKASELLEHLLQDEKRRLLYQALQHLGEDKREVLMLQYFGGLSQKEIAALLRKTPENIRILAYRGKKELRDYMEANGYDLS